MYCISLILIASLILRVESIKVRVFGSKSVDVYCDNDKQAHSRKLDDQRYTLKENDVKKFEHSTSIIFWSCNLPYLPRNFLQLFTSAEKIDFSYRRIQRINGIDFRGNKELKKLYAQNNLLTELTAFLFKYTSKIEEVNFERNRIEKINPSTFGKGVEHLWKINLSYNRIKTLDGWLFKNAVSLRDIDLSRNFIEYFGVKIVHYNEKLDFRISNCMIFPYKNEKMLSINVFQMFEKSDELFKLTDVTVNGGFYYSDDLFNRFMNGVYLHIVV